MSWSELSSPNFGLSSQDQPMIEQSTFGRTFSQDPFNQDFRQSFSIKPSMMNPFSWDFGKSFNIDPPAFNPHKFLIPEPSNLSNSYNHCPPTDQPGFIWILRAAPTRHSFRERFASHHRRDKHLPPVIVSLNTLSKLTSHYSHADPPALIEQRGHQEKEAWWCQLGWDDHTLWVIHSLVNLSGVLRRCFQFCLQL